MATLIDPQKVLDAAAFRMHLPAFASGEFVTSADALMMLQSAAERLTAMLIRSFGDDYGVSVASLATQAGVDLVSIPSNLATVRALFWVDPAGKAHRMRHAEIKDWQPEARTWSTGEPPTYSVQANVIVLQPVPSEVYSLQLEYTTAVHIASVSEMIMGQAGWSEWLTLDLCEQISDRERTDPSRWTIRKQGVEADIRAQAQQRDRFVPQQVVDERGANRLRLSRWR